MLVQPYSSIDTTATWKKLRFILSIRSDFHMTDSLSTNIFLSFVETLFIIRVLLLENCGKPYTQKDILKIVSVLCSYHLYSTIKVYISCYWLVLNFECLIKFLSIRGIYPVLLGWRNTWTLLSLMCDRERLRTSLLNFKQFFSLLKRFDHMTKIIQSQPSSQIDLVVITCRSHQFDRMSRVQFLISFFFLFYKTSQIIDKLFYYLTKWIKKEKEKKVNQKGKKIRTERILPLIWRIYEGHSINKVKYSLRS